MSVLSMLLEVYWRRPSEFWNLAELCHLLTTRYHPSLLVCVEIFAPQYWVLLCHFVAILYQHFFLSFYWRFYSCLECGFNSQSRRSSRYVFIFWCLALANIGFRQSASFKCLKDPISVLLCINVQCYSCNSICSTGPSHVRISGTLDLHNIAVPFWSFFIRVVRRCTS